MLDKGFCDFLEGKLSEAFANSDNESAKHFWCDGVLLPDSENELSIKSVNDERQILMSAFVGKTGQDRYDLLVKFGPKSLSRYARGLDVTSNFSNPPKSDWFEVDVVKKKLTVFLP